ncbi:hypothetical protein [Rhodopirellula bahusiensis]|uniref:Uncharacterized protein n=1 Tax=Rhodopirellula bahusiensis TaxID=2014065 RepID=A0A2G1W1B5_9BACT|nr:hypothetical protein [Rhodopirellula bahusiensis]PHQ32828.1 hypothetical protein CEE69_23905 [Rhodopirellula bahusiensis]
MSRGSVLTLVIILAGCVWRGLWLSAGVADQTYIADSTRAELLTQVADELKTRGQVVDSQDLTQVEVLAFFADADSTVDDSASWQLESVQRFDSDAEVWIVPGADGKPGWDGWDDNQDGTVDDLGELGAAWSDDHCLTPLDPGYEQVDPAHSRIINRGTYVSTDFDGFAEDLSIDANVEDHKRQQWRLTFVNQAAAESL